jgi:hypothetical protein
MTRRLHIHSDSFVFGGAENMVVRLLSQLPSKSLSVTFSCSSSKVYREGMKNWLQIPQGDKYCAVANSSSGPNFVKPSSIRPDRPPIDSYERHSVFDASSLSGRLLALGNLADT